MKVPRAFLEEAKRRCTPSVECPALLFGRGDEVEGWAWAENISASPYSFLLRTEEVYAEIKSAEEKGLGLVAIFHTHPGRPRPSPTDVKYMGLWPVAWIIADVFTWEVRAWRLAGGRLEEIPINVA